MTTKVSITDWQIECAKRAQELIHTNVADIKYKK